VGISNVPPFSPPDGPELPVTVIIIEPEPSNCYEPFTYPAIAISTGVCNLLYVY